MSEEPRIYEIVICVTVIGYSGNHKYNIYEYSYGTRAEAEKFAREHLEQIWGVGKTGINDVGGVEVYYFVDTVNNCAILGDISPIDYILATSEKGPVKVRLVTVLD